jgi:hypothetical protein
VQLDARPNRPLEEHQPRISRSIIKRLYGKAPHRSRS